MISRKITYIFIAFLVFCSSALWGVNWNRLGSGVDFFYFGIWEKEPCLVNQVYEFLDFLDDNKDKELIEKDACSEADFAISSQIQEEEFAEAFSYYKEFAETCLGIFRDHNGIDKLTQVAVSMLFERVSEKFFAHYRFLKHSRELSAQDQPRPEAQQVPVHSVSPKCGTDLFQTERPFSPTPGPTQGKAF